MASLVGNRPFRHSWCRRLHRLAPFWTPGVLIDQIVLARPWSGGMGVTEVSSPTRTHPRSGGKIPGRVVGPTPTPQYGRRGERGSGEGKGGGTLADEQGWRRDQGGTDRAAECGSRGKNGAGGQSILFPLSSL